MVIQGQQISYVQPQNGGGQERDVDHPPEPPVLVLNPAVVARVNASRRKRGKKETADPAATAAAAAAAAAQATAAANSNFLFLQAFSPSRPPQMLFSPVRLPAPRPAPFVSGGFQLFEEQNQHQFFNQPNPLPPSSSQVLEAFTPIIKQYLGDVEGYLRAQDEQLRRTLSEKWQRHCRTLLCVAEMAAAQKIREKEAEVGQAKLQCVELQQQLANTRTESLVWQAKAATAQGKAVAAQHDAAVLRAQLERAMATAPEGTGESGGGLAEADDAESSQAGQCPAATWSCRACRRGKAAVAVVPCGHLCLCADCGAAGPVVACPWCGRLSSGSIHVVFC